MFLAIVAWLGTGLGVPVGRAQDDAGARDATVAGERDAPGDRPVPPRLLGTAPVLPRPGDAPTGLDAVPLRLEVDAAGRVRSAALLSPAGSPVMRERALRSALDLRFAPARWRGEPMAARVVYEARFAPASASSPASPSAPETAPAPGSSSPSPASAVATADASEHRSTRGAEEEIIDVLVTGSRVPERADEAVVPTEIIDREAIEQGGFRDAAEVLEESPSVQVVRGVAGAELWLRGLDPEYTLVLVDGERVPGRIAGAVDLSRYGVENIERVEIVRGPSSAIYGSDAIGGVVNLITRPATDEDIEADARASYGSNGVLDATGRVASSPVEGLRVSGTAGYHRADAFGQSADEPGTTGSAREQWSAGGKAEWRPSEGHLLSASGHYQRLQLDGVDAGAGRAVFDRTQRQEQAEARLAHRFAPNESISLETRAFYSRFREQYLLDQRGSNRLDVYEDSREHLFQLTSTTRIIAGPDHRLAIGFEQLVQQLESPRISDTGRRTRFALFAEDRWSALPWLTVNPGVRVDIDSQFGNQVSPKLALRADATDELVFRASYGRGFRAPSFRELLLRFENPAVGYVVAGNPDLDAERSHGVDAGVEWRPTGDLTFGASFFRNDIDNMIAVVTVEEGTADGTLFSYRNIASAWTMGAESSAQLALTRWLRVSAGYAFTATRDQERDRQLEGRARHRPTASVRAAIPGIDVDVVGRTAVLVGRTYYVDDDGDGDEERLVADPLTQLDFRAERRFGQHVGVFLGVDNVLDAGDRFTVFRPRTFYGGAWARY